MLSVFQCASEAVKARAATAHMERYTSQAYTEIMAFLQDSLDHVVRDSELLTHRAKSFGGEHLNTKNELCIWVKAVNLFSFLLTVKSEPLYSSLEGVLNHAFGLCWVGEYDLLCVSAERKNFINLGH